MTTKVCTKCNTNKLLKDFYKDKTRVDGYSYVCKVCKKGKDRKYYLNNLEAKKKHSREYYQNNKGQYNAYGAKRRATKLRATPPWADLGKIQEVYAEAQRLTELLGIEMQVDHIVPLQGQLVSGLHVHDNLQILTYVENGRKTNRFEVG